jgi:23S rRNA pseudouridine1911/1915/1917 synthase
VFEALRDELAAGRIDKTYVALCAGDVSAPMTIDAPLASDPRDRRRVAASPGGRSGRTEVRSSERVGGLSLVRVRAPRAGRHQVRAHLAHLGHALAGDVLYGGPAIHGLERHFLHAASMALAHPATGRDLVVESPLPPDLAGVVEALCS